MSCFEVGKTDIIINIYTVGNHILSVSMASRPLLPQAGKGNASMLNAEDFHRSFLDLLSVPWLYVNVT
jgi:hypothetical protein